MGSIDTILKISMSGSIMLGVWGLNKFLGEVDIEVFRFIGKSRCSSKHFGYGCIIANADMEIKDMVNQVAKILRKLEYIDVSCFSYSDDIEIISGYGPNWGNKVLFGRKVW